MHLEQVRGRLEEFRAFGAEVIAVSFAQPCRLGQYLKARPWPFRVLSDPDRAAYRAFGLETAKWSRLLRPRVLASYLGLIFRGWLPRPAQEDVHQLGGDFVLDDSGEVVYSYRSTDPADRPDAGELLDAVARISRAQGDN